MIRVRKLTITLKFQASAPFNIIQRVCVEEVKDMKKMNHPFFFTLFFCLMLCFSIPAEAQTPPERATQVQGDIDPYEVTLYRGTSYLNPIATWKLAPGMRMLKIPNIGDNPNSILLGSKVGALLFPATDFSARLGQAYAYRSPYPYMKVANSTPLLQYTGESLIIHRKDISDFLGVYLRSAPSDSSRGQFYPLPEKASESAIIYQKMPYGGPFILEFIHGGSAKDMAMLPSPNPPSIYDMVVNITSDNGVTLTLPDPKINVYPYFLAQYKVGQISSMKIQYKGPYTAQSYLDVPLKAQRAPAAPDPPIIRSQGPTTGQTPTAVRAPAAPDPIPGVSGKWNSSIGFIYNITQERDQFAWTVTNRDERGQGVVKGSDVTASWKGQQGSGSSQGKITAMDPNSKATKIDWDNGVRFYR
jgi:hypothetical protein